MKALELWDKAPKSSLQRWNLHWALMATEYFLLMAAIPSGFWLTTFLSDVWNVSAICLPLLSQFCLHKLRLQFHAPLRLNLCPKDYPLEDRPRGNPKMLTTKEKSRPCNSTSGSSVCYTLCATQKYILNWKMVEPTNQPPPESPADR